MAARAVRAFLRERPLRGLGRELRRPPARGVRTASARRALAVLAGAVSLMAPATGAAEPPPNVPVTDTALSAYQGPWVAVNPEQPDELGVSFQDGNSFHTCWLALSIDAGESWDQIPLVGPEGLKRLPVGFNVCIRPSFAAGTGDNLYYAYTAGQGGMPGPDAIYLVASSDGGETFRDPVPIDTAPLPPGNAGDENARMATDPRSGRLYVTWRQITGMPPSAQDVLVASSDDGGRTFSAPVRVSSPDVNAAAQHIDVGPDGRVYVTFPVSSRPTPDPAKPLPVQVATSSDGGRTFGASVTAQEEFNCAQRGANTCAPNGQFSFEGRNANGSQIAAGRAPGDAYLVSYGLESGLGDDFFRIRFSATHDGGATWSRARTIGIPPGMDAHHQITPSISRAPNGRLDIVFYDLAAPSQLESTYMVSSSDGGESFGAPVLLSEVPSDTDIHPALGFGQGPVMGSHLVASTDDTVYSAWTDSRRGEAESAKLDIFSAALSLLPDDGDDSDDSEEPEEDFSSDRFRGCASLTSNVIRGTAARNTIVGTLRADRIFAGDGNDVVEALEGKDCIALGRGNDTGYGGRGADLITGGSGADRMLGSTGDDRMLGGSGEDRLSGGRGRDAIIGGTGRDVVFGGGSPDRIAGGPGADRLGGDSGDDVMSGGSAADRLAGDSGADRLTGGSGADRLTGGGGRDRLSGGSGGDRISADDHRRDSVSCGKGRDEVVADRADQVARDCERVRRRG